MIYDHQTCEQTWSFTIIPLEIGSWNQFLLWNRRQNCTSLISASTQIQGISWRSCRYSQYNHTNPYKLHQFATNWTSEIHWNPLKSIEIWSSLHLTSKPHPKETLKSPHWSPLLPAHCSHCWAGPMRHHGNLACVEDMALLEQSVEHVKPVLEKIMLPM